MMTQEVDQNDMIFEQLREKEEKLILILETLKGLAPGDPNLLISLGVIYFQHEDFA